MSLSWVLTGIGVSLFWVQGWAQDFSPPAPTAPLDLGVPAADMAPPSIPNDPPLTEVPPQAAAPEALPPPAPAVEPAPVVTASPVPEPHLESPPPAPESPATAEPESAPLPPPLESSPEIDARSLRAADIRVPLYQRTLPTWGFQFAISPRGLGSKSLFFGQDFNKLKAFSFSLEHQPKALQGGGLFAFGPTATIYPEIPSATLSENKFGIWSIGGQIRYQARYFREQPLVPYGGLNLEMVDYRLINGARGHILSMGGVLGAGLLLNALNQSEAAEFYANYGVTRSYLIAEFRGYSGSDINMDLGGASLFFGLRLEY